MKYQLTTLNQVDQMSKLKRNKRKHESFSYEWKTLNSSVSN